MITSRDRVIKTLNFEEADRVPRDLWVLPGAQHQYREAIDTMMRRFPSDIGKASNSPGTNRSAMDDHNCVGTYTDDWGSVWQRAEPGVIGEVKAPALADIASLSHYKLPWHLIQNRSFDEVNAECDRSEKFMLSAVTARPFERLQFLRGSENLFMDIAYDSKEFRELLARVHEFYLEDIRGWCESQVDAVFLMDDWGAQRQLLISPETWRAVFGPLYRDYCDRIHAAGKFVFFHTDGFTLPIWPDLIAAGVDAINAQIFTMDIEHLGKEFGGRVTIWGEVDRQYLLPFGTPEEVARGVERVRAAFGATPGGVIAQCEWGINNPPENISAVFESWLAF
jgi:uroporphyrinogen decarboxylase